MSGVVSVGVAVTAIAVAVETGFETFAVIAAVGATVGAIGAVAKIPALQIAGAAIGVVGAVGGLASAAGAFGAGGVFGSGGTVGAAFAGPSAVASSAGQFTESAAQIAGTNAAAAAGLGGAPELGAAGAWGQGGAGVIDTVNAGGVAGMSTPEAAASPVAASGTVNDQFGNVIAQGDGEGTSLGNVRNPGEQLAQSAQTNDILRGGAGIPDATVGSTSGRLISNGPLVDATAPDYINGGVGSNSADASINKTGSTDITSPWGGIKDFLKDNKTLVSGAIQGGASFLSGALSPLTPAQVAALNAQAKANEAAARRSDAEAAILGMRASNMGQPIPVASRITGRPALGIVNSASPITGVPA